MKILREDTPSFDLQALERAWTLPATFVLVSAKLSVDDQWLADCAATLPPHLREWHFILLTSGSTGSPKLVIGERRRADALVAILHHLQSSDVVEETLLLLPLSYSYSFVNQWLWARQFRRRLVPTRGLADPHALRENLRAAHQAMLCLVGVQVPLLVNAFPTETFPGVWRIHFAGGRFPQEQLPQLKRLFPEARVYNNYGCAEAMPRLALRSAEAADDPANIGQPLPGVELQTDGADRLFFRSPYRAIALIENQVCREIQPDEWLPTGDLAAQDGDGAWRLLGRGNDIFKRHGEKVSLLALLATVSAPWSGQCAFYRERDPTGEDGCVLVLTPLATREAINGVLLALRRKHPRAHWPLRIETLSALPLLPNGKTDIRALTDLAGKAVVWRQLA